MVVECFLVWNAGRRRGWGEEWDVLAAVLQRSFLLVWQKLCVELGS